MKRLLMVLVVLMMAATVQAATLSWTAPNTYTDASAISAADIARIVYHPFYGNTSTGPWTAGTTTAAGATSATVPYPAAGQTLWYTLDAMLDGQTSAKAASVSYTMPQKTPSAPISPAIQ